MTHSYEKKEFENSEIERLKIRIEELNNKLLKCALLMTEQDTFSTERSFNVNNGEVFCHVQGGQLDSPRVFTRNEELLAQAYVGTCIQF